MSARRIWRTSLAAFLIVYFYAVCSVRFAGTSAGRTMASPNWLNPGPPKPSKVQEKTYGRLLVKIVNAHPVQKGDTSAIHGTVGLLSEEGREYASPISSNETVVFYYVRKSKPATSPQLDFQLYAGAQAVIPHRFRRRGVNSPPTRGDDMVMSPASPARFLGEGTLPLLKEWPRKGVLDKEGACVEAVDVCVDGVATYSLDVSIEFRPDRSRDAREMDDDSVGNGANVGADAILLSPDARLPSQASWSTPALKSGSGGKAEAGSNRRIADAAGDGSPSWAIAEDANDRAEKGTNRGLVVYSPPPTSPFGASPAAMKMAEIEKKGPLSDAEYRIFVLYDRGNKGHLTVEEFKMFLKDMNSSGFSAENLARADKGICGLVVSLPGEPLGMYLVHNHSIFSVCYGNGNDKMVTSLPDRLFLVIIIFLYSASLTCAMAQFFPQVPYVYRVVGQSIIDAFGLTVITTLYSLSHRKACPDCGRYLGDALLSVVFIFLLSLLWIRAQKLDAAVETLRTLLPNWLAGRFTEVFKVAASWGFRVQYGSTQGVL